MNERRLFLRELIARLGSMTLAIVLLVVLASASAIGTVLLQNEDHQGYFDEFGPLWYWAFRSLGLFDMYHAWWFLTILAFLMLSLAACLWRNAPKMLKEMRVRKAWLGRRHFEHLRFRHDLRHDDAERLIAAFKAALPGWAFAEAEAEGARFVRADAGRFNKWGYILAHAGILVILIGGWISVQFGFRGNMAVVEGGVEDTISFLRGTETRRLKMPFQVRCNDFSIEFYPTGQPKEFRSSLTILDHGKEVLTRDIVVNEPLEYQGVRIYQASFGDGGSRIRLKLFALDPSGEVREADTRVYETWRDPYSGVSLEITDFKPFNVENLADPGQPKQFRDLGPAVEMIVRGPGLKPAKVKVFMQPFVDLDGVNRGSFLLLSLTGQPDDYETLPLGVDFTEPREWALFLAFMRRLNEVFEDAGVPEERKNIVAFRRALDDVFGDERPENLQEIAMRVLQATQVLPRLPWPFVPMLEDYDQVYYTGLQLTKDPGMNVVWFGSAVLTIGLMIMFYLPHRRLWLRIEPNGRAALAGATNRGELDFGRFVHEVFTKLVESGAAKPTTEQEGAR